MVVAGLGGCAIAPDLGVRPEPAQPSAFASDRSLAGTSHNWPTDSWWQDLGDRQLDTLVSEALDNSPTIEQAAARIQMGFAKTDRAQPPLLPSAIRPRTARSRLFHQSIGFPTAAARNCRLDTTCGRE